QIEPLREIEMSLEHRDLRLARRVHVVIVEADFSDRHDALLFRQSLDLRERRIVAIFCFMRMKADRAPDVVVFLRDLDCLRCIVEFRSRHDKAADVLLARSRERRAGVGHRQVAMRVCESDQTRSTIIDSPMPPEMQSVARPIVLSCHCNACSSVVVMRAPVQPIGCPRAIAPPWTFSFWRSKCRSRSQAITCAANASFNSMRS